MKVLHVVENLNRGAVEMWLVRMLRQAVRSGIALDWTFYCALPITGQLEDQVRDLGGRIIYSPVPVGRKITFARALRAELQHGKYEVLHCHHDLVSAVYLVSALSIPIRRRIVHVHNADEAVLTPHRLKRAVLRPLLRHICLMLADRIVGISNHTLDTFLAGRTRRQDRDVVHYYGVESARFREAKKERNAFRRELRLPENARILLFAGRMVPEKNPLFAVEVLAAMRQVDSSVAGVFVGSGSLDASVRERAKELGLGGAFAPLGWRDDVPEIMCCCDWFILPHPEHPIEGFGLAVVEAQLAGLRLLLSHGIPDDPLLPGASFHRLALAAGPEAWAKAAVELMGKEAPSREAAIRALSETPMDMDRALEGLVRLHG